MKILVANLGSTSFKYRLFDMTDERQLARGGIERIGSPVSSCSVEIGGQSREQQLAVPDHAEAVRQCLAQLTDPETGCLKDAGEVSAIGFKAVHGGKFCGVFRVTPEVLAEMERLSLAAPAHNRPYVAAMRQVGEKLPHIPLVAAFETGFHQTIPPRNRHYAVPYEWAEQYGLQRWGFHGASHRYIATRAAELKGRSDLRIISCHLGGSSSICAIRNGQSVAASMGMSPQTGLPQTGRVGDFDAYALPLLMEQMGKTLPEVLAEMASKGGLLGLSGVSGDVRDLEAAAAQGHARAQLALDVFTSSVRHYLGAYLVELGGADMLVFTGGIGEKGRQIRQTVCANLQALGIELDLTKNASHSGEGPLHSANSKTEIWIIPTNEEIIVARQTKAALLQIPA